MQIVTLVKDMFIIINAIWGGVYIKYIPYIPHVSLHFKERKAYIYKDISFFKYLKSQARLIALYSIKTKRIAKAHIKI